MAQSLAQRAGTEGTPPGPGDRCVLARRLRGHRLLLPLVVLALLAGMAFAMVSTAVAQSPTTDEPVYVGTAVVYLEQHSLRYNTEHPPLGKLIMDTGLFLVHPRLDPSFPGDEWALGNRVLFHSGNDPATVLLAARLPIIVLTLLFGLVVFLFARDVAGPVAGVVALTLYVFDPDLIAHGSLATLDVLGAGFLLTTAWLLWRARRRALPYLPAAGVALGAAMATRMSTLPAVPVLLLLAVLSYRAARGGWWRAVGAAAGVLVIALAVVWVSYLLVDPHLRFTASGVPAVPGVRGLVTDLMPLPEPYRAGMRIQFGFERSSFGGFLFGRAYQGSLWYYLPAALLVKTPLGMLALWAAGSGVLLAVRRLRPAALYVLLPAAVLFAAALDGSRDFGTRYAIFLPMFLAIAAGTLVAPGRRWIGVATAALVLTVAVSSARTYPYYLPYSNEAFGGPAMTWQRLHDSNSDWGQDLARVADRVRDRYAGEPVWVVYKGGGDPGYYLPGSAAPLPVRPEQVHGVLVVSNDAIDKADPRLTVLLAGAHELEQVGHSITIFRR